MNAIKLPVRAVCTTSGLNILIDAEGTTICNTGGSSYLANQISILLNLHDELVAELERLRACIGGADFEITGKILEKLEGWK